MHLIHTLQLSLMKLILANAIALPWFHFPCCHSELIPSSSSFPNVHRQVSFCLSDWHLLEQELGCTIPALKGKPPDWLCCHRMVGKEMEYPHPAGRSLEVWPSAHKGFLGAGPQRPLGALGPDLGSREAAPGGLVVPLLADLPFFG